MPNDTRGFIIVSYDKTTMAAFVQSIGRLRNLKKKDTDKQQTATIVVTMEDRADRPDGPGRPGRPDGSDSTKRPDRTDGPGRPDSTKRPERPDSTKRPDRTSLSELAEALKRNEATYKDWAVPVQEAQIKHAKKYKDTRYGFHRPVEYKSLEAAHKQHQAETESQSQSQNLTQRAVNYDKACFADTRELDDSIASMNLRNALTHSQIREALGKIKVAISPMMSIKELNGKSEFRAFAVASDSSDYIVAMTVIEAWTKYAGEEADATYGYDHYTYDGHLIRERNAQKASKSTANGTRVEGVLLFGRLLCDDTLTLEEEVALLRYFDERYGADAQKALTDVLHCLSSSGFLLKLRQCTVLHELTTKDASTVIGTLNLANIAKKASGGNKAIERIVLAALSAGPATIAPVAPVAASAPMAQSFGRKRRSMFV